MSASCVVRGGVIQRLGIGMEPIEPVGPPTYDHDPVKPRIQSPDKPGETAEVAAVRHLAFPNSGPRARLQIPSACARPRVGWAAESSHTCRMSVTGKPARDTAARNTASG